MERLEQQARNDALKVCPQCGELLFADMDVCYGCLYDFRHPTSDMRHNPLATIELDEVEFDEELGDASPTEATESDDGPAGEGEITGDAGVRIPRHRRSTVSAEDTFDLGRQEAPIEEAPPEPPAPSGLAIVIAGKEMEVRLPLEPAGLTVGRSDDNDIILRSRLVSRHHLRILPAEGGAAVEDCGATNPAELKGSPLEGTQVMQPGDELRVCETVFGLAASA